MFEKVRVKNFKCFDDLTVEDLGTITLVVGDNNVGKTALLEALWLACAAPNPRLSAR